MQEGIRFTAVIGESYEVVIPKEIVEKLHLKPGGQVDLVDVRRVEAESGVQRTAPPPDKH